MHLILLVDEADGDALWNPETWKLAGQAARR